MRMKCRNLCSLNYAGRRCRPMASLIASQSIKHVAITARLANRFDPLSIILSWGGGTELSGIDVLPMGAPDFVPMIVTHTFSSFDTAGIWQRPNGNDLSRTKRLSLLSRMFVSSTSYFILLLAFLSS
jgi:hypothetical protein